MSLNVIDDNIVHIHAQRGLNYKIVLHISVDNSTKAANTVNIANNQRVQH